MKGKIIIVASVFIAGLFVLVAEELAAVEDRWGEESAAAEFREAAAAFPFFRAAFFAGRVRAVFFAALRVFFLEAAAVFTRDGDFALKSEPTRSSRLELEWSFGSPSMAIVPP